MAQCFVWRDCNDLLFGFVDYFWLDPLYERGKQNGNGRKKYGYYELIPVYKEDGKVEIGSLKIGGN